MMDQDYSHLTDEELADIGVPPHGLSDEEYAAAQQEMRELRLKQIAAWTPEKWIEVRLTGIKYRLMRYFKSGEYEEKNSFGAVLQEYMQDIGKTSAQLSEDLGISQAQLDCLFKNQEYPAFDLFYKLEIHSSGFFDRWFWWRLLMKTQENRLHNDEKLKKIVAAQMKNVVKLAA